MIEFDPALHEYRYNGQRIRSVTQILKDAGLIDDRWFSEEARDRGSAVHDLCEQYAKGTRHDAVGRAMESLEYINAFAAWCQDYQTYALRCEQVVWGEVNGERYGGKFDLLSLVSGRRVLIDLKTGASAKWHNIQLAGYALARMNDTGEPVNPDAIARLYLKPSGRYQYAPVSGLELAKAIRDFKECIHG